MRFLALTAVFLGALAAGCGSGDGSAAREAVARLTITLWPRGTAAGDERRFTLRCGPTGGTHPTRVRACARLTALEAPFKSVPRFSACTEIYGGPQEAHVTGTFRGRPVDTRFRRTNGCEIERWGRIAVLFPVAVGAF